MKNRRERRSKQRGKTAESRQKHNLIIKHKTSKIFHALELHILERIKQVMVWMSFDNRIEAEMKKL